MASSLQKSVSHQLNYAVYAGIYLIHISKSFEFECTFSK